MFRGKTAGQGGGFLKNKQTSNFANIQNNNTNEVYGLFSKKILNFEFISY